MPPVSQLASFPLFSRLDETRLQHLSQQEQVSLERNQILMERGRENHHLFVLLEGSLRVQLAPHPGIPLSIVRPGQCIGEETVFGGGNCPLSVVADEDATLLKIPRQVVLELIEVNPAWSHTLMEMMALRLQERNQVLHRYEHATASDLLTGLRNRRWLQTQLDRALSRCQFSKKPLTLIMLDIDHLKQINDQLGHEAGDQILVSITEVLRYQLRPDAMLARYCGEELVVLLPELALDIGILVAERLRKAVEQLKPILPDGRELPPVTISVGMAQALPGEKDTELLARTEAALAQAKRLGRNRVETAPAVIRTRSPVGS